MCSVLLISTAVVIPTIIVSSIFFNKFVHHDRNEAVIAIKLHLDEVAAKTQEARDLLSVKDDEGSGSVFLRKDLSDCSSQTGAFEDAVSATVHAAVDSTFDAVSKFFSWNFLSVLGLLNDKAFQLRVKELGAEVLDLLQIKSKSELQTTMEDPKADIPKVLAALEADAIDTCRPVFELLHPQAALVLAHLQERARDEELVARVQSGVSAEEVWKFLFERIGDDKSEIARELKAGCSERFCSDLAETLHGVAAPLIWNLSKVFVMLERLGSARAVESLASFDGDCDRAYAAVEGQTANSTKHALELVKPYVDTHNQMSEEDYGAVLKLLSDPGGFLVEVKEAAKQVVLFATAAKMIQQQHMASLEDEAAALELEIVKADEANDDLDESPKLQLQDVGPGLNLKVARDKLRHLRLKSRDVSQRSVCGVVKTHAFEVFPAMRGHC